MRIIKSFLLVTLAFTAFSAQAEDYTITLHNKVFEPAALEIPKDTQVKILVKNQDEKPAEFESSDIKREKVIAANSEAIVLVGPLSAGEYHYYNDFDRKSEGVIVVK